ncbi:ComEC/Rec2 family competence protein [Pedobacter sp. B4-66]|uniref:ComEC/Rec2 family competence protein n=1 Tax=Pedobacter sp. B4-66 TaxID=2817280 RepID=UPI001BD9E437|nr:ComEC/Rec2 family competence protein [Pedobacter sp. B4-66]
MESQVFKAEVVFLRILLPFSMGIIAFYHTTSASLVYWIGLLCLISFTILIIINLFYKKLKAYNFKSWTAVLIYILLFLLGAFTCIANKQRLNKDYFGVKKQAYLRVWVNDEPQLKSGILRFRASVTKSYLPKKSDPIESIKAIGKLMVSVKTDSLNSIRLSYGDELIIPARITEIAPPYNPAEFDYKSWLASQNIYHQVYLKQAQLTKTNTSQGNPIIAYALALRTKQVQYYRKRIKDDDAFAMAATLILGYRADLSQETLSTYSKTGTIHALSVSGMHVGLIYLVLNWMLQYLNRNSLLKLLKVGTIIILVWLYALLTGFSPSVLRSAIMLSAFIIAKSFNRQSNSYNIIAFAAFCLLVYNPFLIWDVGFQLSFLAVLGLIYLQPKIQNWWHPQNKWINKLWGIIAMSLAAQLITFPFSIYYFHQFPIYFLISNLFIMVPIALLMYLGIVILLGRFEFLAPIFEWLIKFTNSGLKWIADLPLSSLSAIWISRTELLLLSVALYCIAVALAGFKKRMLLFSLTCFMVFQSFAVYDKVEAIYQKKIIVFNIRKNYATAFISKQKAIVFTNLLPENKGFKYFIQPALDQHKIKEIVCIKGNKDTTIADFKLKNQDVAFYNYRINRFHLKHYDLKTSKAHEENLDKKKDGR